MQLGVGVDDADEGHVVEIEAFGDHLSAEQHRRLGRAEALEQLLVRAFGRGGVGVHADDGHLGPHPRHAVQERAQIRFHPLRASTELL